MSDEDKLVPNPLYTPDRFVQKKAHSNGTEARDRELISTALRRLLMKNEQEFAQTIAMALINAGSLPDERCVSAAKVILERTEGPVERVMHHRVEDGTQKRLVIDPTLLPERSLIGIEGSAVVIQPPPQLNGNGHSNGHETNGHSHGS